MHDRMLSDTLDAQDIWKKKSATYRPNLWRFVMENKVTRYSAAAVVILAIALVLFGPFGPSKNGGIVLADVQQRVDGVETMVIRGQKTFLRPGKDGDVFEFDGIKGRFDIVRHMSKQYGFTEEGYAGDTLVYRLTFNRPRRQTLFVLPPRKKYLKFTSTERVEEILENMTPKGIFSQLLECDHRRLGPDNIDGVEVEGFEFLDADPFKGILPKAVFDMQQCNGKIWIGIKEQLPIRLEGNLAIGKCFMTMFNDLNLHEVNVLEEYDVELDDELFDPKIPEGYTELGLGDILPLIPVEVKAGLAGLSIAPAGFVVWRRRRRKRATL
jgi:hypothetical protein